MKKLILVIIILFWLQPVYANEQRILQTQTNDWGIEVIASIEKYGDVVIYYGYTIVSGPTMGQDRVVSRIQAGRFITETPEAIVVRDKNKDVIFIPKDKIDRIELKARKK